MSNYIKEMKKCIALARKARGKTSPNPLVGCVVLNEAGEVISVGYHKKYGDLHAERFALSQLKDAKNCTLVVNLEPCCHYGKTPPCTDIIFEKGIKKVVYGMKDPNPIVSGKGLEILKNAGIDVVGPVLEEECKNLNEIFIKNKTQNKTYIAIKTATTIDGKIATHNGDSKWITSSKARKYVYKLRKYYDAILTSSSTVISDNPKMKHDKKIVIDRELKTDFMHSEIYKQGLIYVFHDKKYIPNTKKDNINFIPVPSKNNKLDIDTILTQLFELGIMSVFVEAGGEINGSFLSYADKLYHFVASKILADKTGISCFSGKEVNFISKCFNLKFESIKILSPDILITYSKQ